MQYGYSVEWYPEPGGRKVVSVSGFDSGDEAEARGVEAAVHLGWAPRKWWQWWRFGERRSKKLLDAFAQRVQSGAPAT